MDWVVYVLKDPRNNAVRYIGRTAESRTAKRLRSHIFDAVKFPDENHRHRWIASLVRMGLSPVMEVIEAGDGDGWVESEQRLIAYYRANGASLVNGTDGGDGTTGRTVTEEQRAHHSDAAKIHMANQTTEQREKRRLTMQKINASRTPEERRAFAAHANAHRTPEGRLASVSALNTAEQREKARLRMESMHANRTPEERRAFAAHASASRTPEQRIGLNLTAEQRENRRLRIKKINATRTPEQLRAAAGRLNTEAAREKRRLTIQRNRIIPASRKSL